MLQPWRAGDTLSLFETVLNVVVLEETVGLRWGNIFKFRKETNLPLTKKEIGLKNKKRRQRKNFCTSMFLFIHREEK